MTSPPAPVRHRRRREETRRAIVDAGERLFGRQGFSRTSMRDIAAAVGVTEPALYRHFASKKELFDAVVEERGEVRWLEWVEETRRSVPMDVALERMGVMALRFFELNRDLVRLILFEALAGDPGAVAHHEGVMARWHAGVRTLLGGEAVALSDEETAGLAGDFVAWLWGVALQRLLGVDPVPLVDEQGEPTERCRALSHRIIATLLPAHQPAEADCPVSRGSWG